jgi:hypothetical protein
MDEADMRTMLRGLADTVEGSARVDLPLAARQGRRNRRWRRMRVSGSVFAVGAAIAAVLVLPGHRAAGVAPAVPASPASASAPKEFSPLVPYAAFSWLPARWHVGQKNPTFQNDEMAMSTPTLLDLPVWAPAGGADLLVFPAGQCKSTATTLLCNWQDITWRKQASAPEVNGRRAYWLTEVGAAPGSPTIAWQYAPGGWAMLSLSSATRARSGQALALSLAAAVRFGGTAPVLFPYRFTGMAGSWQVSEVDYTMDAGQPAARMLHLTSGRLRKQIQLDVSPPGTVDEPCGKQGTASGTATLDGARVEILRKGGQLCGDDVDGLQIDLFIENGVNGVAATPSGSGSGEVLGYARELHLLGTSQANWTANPLR